VLNLDKINIPSHPPGELLKIDISQITQPFLGKVIDKFGVDLLKNVDLNGLRLMRDIIDIVPIRKRVPIGDSIERLEKRKWKTLGKYISMHYNRNMKLNRKEFIQMIKYNITTGDVLDLIVQTSKNGGQSAKSKKETVESLDEIPF
jgi:hypothetical protein